MAQTPLGSLAYLLRAETVLSTAQLATLNSAPVVLVPAPGANQVLVILGQALVYNFGTIPYYPVGGGADVATVEYVASGTALNATVTPFLAGNYSEYAYTPGSTQGRFAFSDGVGSGIQLISSTDYPHSGVGVADVAAPGLGYALGDTGTLTTGNGDATYIVTGVGALGIVTNVEITYPGTGYALGAGQATAIGPPQAGIGDGNLAITVTSLVNGDGTLKVITYYQILDV